MARRRRTRGLRRRPHRQKGWGLRRYRPKQRKQREKGVGAIMAGLSLLPLLF